MPRVRRPTSSDEPMPGEEPIPGTENIRQDPIPRGRPPRKRAAKAPAKATGTRGKIPVRTAGGGIMSKAQKVEKVSTEIYMWLTLTASSWELREELQGVADPCARILFEEVTIPTPHGPVMEERLAAIASRITAIAARNTKVLDTLAKSGVIGDIAMLATLLWPVGRLVLANHVMGAGHARGAEATSDELAARYPVPEFAN